MHRRIAIKRRYHDISCLMIDLHILTTLWVSSPKDAIVSSSDAVASRRQVHKKLIKNWIRALRVTGCVQQEKLLCNCCKIRESDWCMLLDSVKIKSIH